MNFGYVKVGAFTPKIKVADTVFNTKSIIEGIKEAKQKNVELLVMPELCLCGYTCGDLVYYDTLLSGVLDGLKQIKEATKNIEMLIFVGAPMRVKGLLYNTAVAINKGKILGVIPKTYLPNSNEFYEKRYFAKANDVNSVIEIDGEEIPFGKRLIFKDKENENFTVSAEICQDLWSVMPPSTEHAINGANIIVNLSCCNETVNKAKERERIVASHSARLVAGYVYADAGEGESTTDLVFSGHNIVAENGKILDRTSLFENGLAVSEIDVENIVFERSKAYNYDLEKSYKYEVVEFTANNGSDEITKANASTGV